MKENKPSFTDEQKKVLDLVQRRFPLEEKPYRKLGDLIGISEAEVIDHIRELKENRVIRQISAIFNIILPAVKKYKLAMVLDVMGEDNDFDDEEDEFPDISPKKHFEPTEENIRIVRCVQEDLPLDPRPFSVWANQLGVTEDFLLEWLISKDKGGVIRRFAAVLDHRRAGFTANGMIVWHCKDEELDSLGEYLARQPEVTHCYHRPAYPDWPYNLYAMVHGKTKEECLSIAAKLARLPSLKDYRVLFSTREFKKIRLKLFWDRS